MQSTDAVQFGQDALDTGPEIQDVETFKRLPQAASRFQVAESPSSVVEVIHVESLVLDTTLYLVAQRSPVCPGNKPSVTSSTGSVIKGLSLALEAQNTPLLNRLPGLTRRVRERE